MGQIIKWCKHCNQPVSIEKHDPHQHEHDNDHNHEHTAAHVDQKNHDHNHGYYGECGRCIKTERF